MLAGELNEAEFNLTDFNLDLAEIGSPQAF